MHAGWPATKLGQTLEKLESFYGPPSPIRAKGPFEMILWEIVAYLADDARRTLAFQALEERVGLAPENILAAPFETLQEVARIGGKIAPEERANRLVVAAKKTLDEFGGDLNSVLNLPPKQAKQELMKFPMTGEPGAEKILLFSGMLPVLALESNGLRVLLRLGYGKESKSYSTSYKSVQDATKQELPEDCDLLTKAHLLLRRHGQTTCRRTTPLCHTCPVSQTCSYFLSSKPG